MGTSICLTVYNEEKGIQRILDYLNSQIQFVDDVVIVSDGSIDNTNKIVEKWLDNSPLNHITFIVNSLRLGRATSIRLGLSKTFNDLTVILSGDIQPEPNSLSNIILYFKDSKVGLVTGKAVLLNTHKSIVDCLSHIIWETHNQSREVLSKKGEVIHASGDLLALRKSALKGFDDYRGIVEDAALGLIVNRNGFKTLFASDVEYKVLYPTTIKDYIKTRKRCCYGRVELSRKFGLSGNTFYELSRKEYVINLVKATHFKVRNLLSLCFGVPIEVLARFYYSIKQVDEKKVLKELWQPTTSTKW